MALPFNLLIYVNPRMSMGSLNAHTQAIGGPKGQRGVSRTDRQRLAWKTAPIFDLIRGLSLKQRHIVGSWLRVTCFVCVRACVWCSVCRVLEVGVSCRTAELELVCKCKSVSFIHPLAGLSRPSVVFHLSSPGCHFGKLHASNNQQEGLKTGWGEGKWWIFRVHWNENPRQPLETWA